MMQTPLMAELISAAYPITQAKPPGSSQADCSNEIGYVLRDKRRAAADPSAPPCENHQQDQNNVHDHAFDGPHAALIAGAGEGLQRWISTPSSWPDSSSPSPSPSTSSSRASPSGCQPISRRCWTRGCDRPGSLPVARAVLDQDFRGLVRHGRGVGHRALLSVRHQLEPVLGRGRQYHRPADRLRGADRVLSGGDLSRRSCCSAGTACRAGSRAVCGDRRDRHRDVGVLDSLGQQLDAHAGRLRDARRHRLSAGLVRDHVQSKLPLSLRAHAQRRPISRRPSSCSRSARAISSPADTSRKPAP